MRYGKSASDDTAFNDIAFNDIAERPIFAHSLKSRLNYYSFDQRQLPLSPGTMVLQSSTSIP